MYYDQNRYLSRGQIPSKRFVNQICQNELGPSFKQGKLIETITSEQQKSTHNTTHHTCTCRLHQREAKEPRFSP
jgi:hypothetical protein